VRPTTLAIALFGSVVSFALETAGCQPNDHAGLLSTKRGSMGGWPGVFGPFSRLADPPDSDEMHAIASVDAGALRALCSTPGPIVSVYFDLRATGEQEAPLRWRSLAERLARDGAPPEAIQALRDRVLGSVPGPGVLAAFAAGADVLFAVNLPGSEQPNSARYAQLPHIVPVLAWLQDHPALVAATVDRTGADIVAYPYASSEPISTVVRGRDDEVERNAPGGWSQGRYQHRAEDSWEHNAAQVADILARTLRRFDAHLLLLAGDIRALQYLDEHLPIWVRHGVTVRRISGGRSENESSERHEEEIRIEARLAADEETAALLAELDEGRGRAGQAVEGARETLRALAAARVRILLIDADPAPERAAWFGPGSTDVAERAEYLIEAGVPAERGPLVDVATRAALLTGAGVWMLPPGHAGGPAGGIGALCRFTT